MNVKQNINKIVYKKLNIICFSDQINQMDILLREYLFLKLKALRLNCMPETGILNYYVDENRN
jgi:hypothetical protein